MRSLLEMAAPIVLVSVILFALWKQRAAWLAVAVPLVLWLGVVWVLAARGAFLATPGVRGIPALPVAIGAPVVVGLILLLRSPRVAKLLDATPPSWLIGVQVYRALGFIFLVSWYLGTMPGLFALPAGIGDVIVGLTALPTALRVSSGTEAGRRAGMAWNVFGLVDLTVAITTGFLTVPGPGLLPGLSHPNMELGTFPIVLIPAFMVPASIVLHALSLRQLRRLGAHLHVGHVVGLGRLGQV
jgi:hypothetical protein